MLSFYLLFLCRNKNNNFIKSWWNSSKPTVTIRIKKVWISFVPSKQVSHANKFLSLFFNIFHCAVRHFDKSKMKRNQKIKKEKIWWQWTSKRIKAKKNGRDSNEIQDECTRNYNYEETMDERKKKRKKMSTKFHLSYEIEHWFFHNQPEYFIHERRKLILVFFRRNSIDRFIECRTKFEWNTFCWIQFFLYSNVLCAHLNK